MSHGIVIVIVCILFSIISVEHHPMVISWPRPGWVRMVLPNNVAPGQLYCNVPYCIQYSHTNLSVTFTRENMCQAVFCSPIHIHCNGGGQYSISYSQKDLPFRLFHPSIDSLGYSLYPIWRIIGLSVAIVTGTLESITNNVIYPLKVLIQNY